MAETSVCKSRTSSFEFKELLQPLREHPVRTTKGGRYDLATPGSLRRTTESGRPKTCATKKTALFGKG